MCVACCGFAELLLEQMTLVSNDALLPSSAHAGTIVRALNARPIPSSDAHISMAANGHAVRFRCGSDERLSAVGVDIWLMLDTGSEFPLDIDAFETSTNRVPLVMLVLRGGNAADGGPGILFDVVDDLDRSGLFKDQRALDFLAELQRLLEA